MLIRQKVRQAFSFLGLVVILGSIGCSPMRSAPNLSGPSEGVAAATDSIPHDFGINIDSPAPHIEHYDRASEGKFKWVRVWLWWKWMESEPGKINWSNMDAQISWAKKRGFKIYASIASIPYWANGTRKDCNFWNDAEAVECSRPWPSGSQDYLNFLRQAVKRYRGDIQVWSVWNEPNLKTFWSGTINDYIGLILWPGYQVIKQEAPEALVAGPELASLGPSWWQDLLGRGHDIDWKRWLRDILRFKNPATGLPPLDILSQHDYEGSAAAVVNTITQIRTVMQANGGSHLPFWLTETSFNDCKLGTENQLQQVRSLINEAKSGRLGYWQKTIFHGMAENDELVSQGFCGALTKDEPGFPPKPVFSVFQELLEGATPNPDYSALTPIQKSEMQAQLVALAREDGWWSQGEPEALGGHGWNYYLQKLTGEMGVDLGSVRASYPTFQPDDQMSLDTWWSFVEDFLPRR